MGIAENKQIVQSFYDAANRGDTEGFLSQLAELCCFIVGTIGGGQNAYS